MSDRGGLPDRRGLYDQRPCHTLYPVLHRHRLPNSTRRRNYPSSGQLMDDADSAQCAAQKGHIRMRGGQGQFLADRIPNETVRAFQSWKLREISSGGVIAALA